MKKIIYTGSISVLLIFIIITALIIFSAPDSPPMMETFAAPFRKISLKNIPPVKFYQTRDGSKAAYRYYHSPDSIKTAVLVHGSSGSGIGMHILAEYLQQNKISSYTLDIRGHGDSYPRGDIRYTGQLDDDLEDFRNSLLKDIKDVTLAGFSSGGGFVLRIAGGSKQDLFSRYISLAPFIRYDAPSTKPGNDRWAKASIPRIAVLMMLGSSAEKFLGHLNVLAFAINPATASLQTQFYSYRLYSNFGLHFNYADDLSNIKRPLKIIAGDKDELFDAEKYRGIFEKYGLKPEIKIVPGAGHITLTTETDGLKAIRDAILAKD